MKDIESTVTLSMTVRENQEFPNPDDTLYDLQKGLGYLARSRHELVAGRTWKYNPRSLPPPRM
jgi:hypothetical protein